ncbi:MAG TPA: WYL domain-containing protein [Microlunatus sp.]
MTKPLARVLALLEILQTGGTRTVHELSDRLGVNERTVRRYVGHLLDLGIPVESVRGRYGGYRMAAGHRMPPLMLTETEALVITLGLMEAGRHTLEADTAIAVESAGAKLRRVLPRPVAERLARLLSRTSFGQESDESTPPEFDLLLTIAEAAAERHPIKINYRDGRSRRSDRTVEPYGVVAARGRWYVTGQDRRSDRLRSFRLDRIVAAQIIADRTFTTPSHFDPTAHVLDAVSGAHYRQLISVQVQADEETVRMRLHGIAASISPVHHRPGWLRVRWRVERLEWVPAVLAGLDKPFVIEEPEDLRPLVRTLATTLARYADLH